MKNLEQRVISSVNDRKNPPEIKTLFAEQPRLTTTVGTLLKDGVPLVFHRLKKTPDHIAEAVQRITVEDHHDVRTIWVSPLLRGERVPGDPNALKHITSAVPQFLSIATPLEATKPQKEAIASLNKALAPDALKYAEIRLKTDRTDGEKENIFTMTKLTFLAAGVSTLLNISGAEGVGMAIAGQADDIFGAVTVGKTEEGGKKSIGKIVKDNPLVWAGVTVATVIDLFVLPKLFKTDAETQKLFADAVYWFTATAGSMIASLEKLKKTYKSVKALDRSGNLVRNHELPQELKEIRTDKKFQKKLKKTDEAALYTMIENQLLQHDLSKEVTTSVMQQVQRIDAKTLHDAVRLLKRREMLHMAAEEWVSHPYVRWLLVGLGISLAASEGFGAAGLLEGSSWSGAVQAGIGPIETVSALAGSTLFDHRLHELNRRRNLGLRRRRAKKILEQAV